jgi:hypothetical protein
MDVSTLITKDNYQQFWPSSKQSKIEQVNSSARFIIYGTIVTFVIKRNVRILIVGFIILAALYYYAASLRTPGGASPDTPCSAFNADDPLGNFGTTKCYRPKDAQWWANMAFSTDRRNAERNWHTVPTNDLESHLNFVHGGKNKPFCRQDQQACSLESNSRNMEWPQTMASSGVKSGFF